MALLLPPPVDGSHVPEGIPAVPVRTAVRRSGPAGRALLAAVLATVVAALAGAIVVLLPHTTAPAAPPAPALPIPGPALPGTDRPLEPGLPAEAVPQPRP